jgi:hypothetical protein
MAAYCARVRWLGDGGPPAALDAPLLEGLDVVLDGSAADSEPFGEGGAGDAGLVLPGLDDSVSAFGGVAWWAVRSGPARHAIRHVALVGQGQPERLQ